MVTPDYSPILVAMDLLSPEAMGGAGVGMGAMFLMTMIRTLGKVSKFFEDFSKWLTLQIKRHEMEIDKQTLDAKFQQETRDHYKRMEELERGNNDRLDDLRRSLLAIPRMIHDDITPPPYTPP